MREWPLLLYVLFVPHIAVNVYAHLAGYIELTAFNLPAVLALYLIIPVIVRSVAHWDKVVGGVAFGAVLLIWVPDFAHDLLLVVSGYCLPYPLVPGVCG